MERPYILHMITPGKQMSPFDINMAADAGYQIIVPYCEADMKSVTALTQDAIFSRGPKGRRAPASSSAGATRWWRPTCSRPRRRPWCRPSSSR